MPLQRKHPTVETGALTCAIQEVGFETEKSRRRLLAYQTTRKAATPTVAHSSDETAKGKFEFLICASTRKILKLATFAGRGSANRIYETTTGGRAQSGAFKFLSAQRNLTILGCSQFIWWLCRKKGLRRSNYGHSRRRKTSLKEQQKILDDAKSWTVPWEILMKSRLTCFLSLTCKPSNLVFVNVTRIRI